MPFSCLGSPLTWDNHYREHNLPHAHRLLMNNEAPSLALFPLPSFRRALPNSPLGNVCCLPSDPGAAALALFPRRTALSPDSQVLGGSQIYWRSCLESTCLCRLRVQIWEGGCSEGSKRGLGSLAQPTPSQRHCCTLGQDS